MDNASGFFDFTDKKNMVLEIERIQALVDSSMIVPISIESMAVAFYETSRYNKELAQYETLVKAHGYRYFIGSRKYTAYLIASTKDKYLSTFEKIINRDADYFNENIEKLIYNDATGEDESIIMENINYMSFGSFLSAYNYAVKNSANMMKNFLGL